MNTLRTFYTSLIILSSSILFCNDYLVHFDKNFYAAGDYVFYSIQSSNDTAFIARVVLEGESGPLEAYNIQISKGFGAGYFKLPYELSSDIYRFTVSTFQSEQRDADLLLEHYLGVINTTDRVPIQNIVSEKPDLNKGSIEIIPTRSEVSARQVMTCTLKIDPESLGKNLRVSVSIKDKDLHSEDLPNVAKGTSTVSPRLFERHIIMNANYEQDRMGFHSTLLFGYDASDNVFHIGRELADGVFRFYINPYYGQREISIIDYLEENNFRSEIIEFNPGGADHNNIQTENKDLSEYIQAWNKRTKLNELFKKTELNPEFVAPVKPVAKFEPDYILDVPNFKLRGPLLTIFKEVLTPLKFKRVKKDTYEASVLYTFNSIKKFYDRKPIFVVNGQITRDADFISKIPLQDVKEVRIFSKREILIEHFAPAGMGGMILIDMLDNTYTLPENVAREQTLLQGLQIPINYPVTVDIQEKVVSFNPLLYWNPSVTFSENGEAVIDFQCADDLATYQVEAVFLDKTGAIQTGNATFRVDRKSN